MKEVVGESTDDDYETLNEEEGEDEKVEKNQLVEREDVSSCASSNTSICTLPEINDKIKILDDSRPEAKPSNSPFDLDQYVEVPDHGQTYESN